MTRCGGYDTNNLPFDITREITRTLGTNVEVKDDETFNKVTEGRTRLPPLHETNVILVRACPSWESYENVNRNSV